MVEEQYGWNEEGRSSHSGGKVKSGFTTGPHNFPPTLPTVGLLKSVLSILLEPNGSQIWTKLHKSGIRFSKRGKRNMRRTGN